MRNRRLYVKFLLQPRSQNCLWVQKYLIPFPTSVLSIGKLPELWLVTSGNDECWNNQNLKFADTGHNGRTLDMANSKLNFMIVFEQKH